MTLEELLESLLPAGVVVLLRNRHGSMELRGRDLALKRSESWLTVYHQATDGEVGSETRSHLHLRRGTLQAGFVVEREGRSPVLEFWATAEDALGEGRPPLAITFPSFYDWQNDKAPIPAHRTWFREWVARYGTQFDLQDA